MNPELQRNLILELTPRRVTWALTAVGLTYFATLLVVNMSGYGRLAHATSVMGALAFVGGWMFVGACLVWGARQAGGAVIAEVGERTWDFQRMSAISPWAMTWGKLVGVASLSWLIGLIGLVLFVLYGVSGDDPARALQLTGIGLAAAVLLQAGGLAQALSGVRKARVEGRLATVRNRRSALFGVVALLVAGNGLVRGFSAVRRVHPDLGSGQLLWWGLPFDPLVFGLLSTTVFAAWAVVGAWRLMRLELQSENSVWVWAGFVLFAGLYAAGFAWLPGDVDEAMRWRPLLATVLAGSVFSALAYAAAFAEPADRQRVGVFRRAVQGRSWARAALSMPMILPPLLLAAVAWVLASLLAPGAAAETARFSLGFGERFSPGLVGLAILLFTVRDLGVIAYVRFSPRPRRSDAGAILALVLLYVIGGIIAHVLLGRVGEALTTPFGRPSLLSVIAGAAEAALAWWFAAARIFGRPRTPPDVRGTPLP